MKKVLAFVLPFALPVVVMAQLSTTSLNASLQALVGTVNVAVGLLLAVEALVFIYGVIRYILAKGPEESKNAKTYIIWSLVAIVVTAAVWGIVNLLVSFLGVEGTNTLETADLPRANEPQPF